jgi:ribosome assembly protein YihI (activator of Der GTPase)
VFNELEDENSRDRQRKSNLSTARSSNNSGDQITSNNTQNRNYNSEVKKPRIDSNEYLHSCIAEFIGKNGSSSKVVSLPKNLDCLS